MAGDATLRRALAQDVASELLDNVIRLRRRRGLTQEQLADLMGTTQSFVSRLERGLTNPRASTIERLAQVLDAAVRLDLVPWELFDEAPRAPRWWAAQRHPMAMSGELLNLQPGASGDGAHVQAMLRTLLEAFSQQLVSGSPVSVRDGKD